MALSRTSVEKKILYNDKCFKMGYTLSQPLPNKALQMDKRIQWTQEECRRNNSLSAV